MNGTSIYLKEISQMTIHIYTLLLNRQHGIMIIERYLVHVGSIKTSLIWYLSNI